MKRWLLVASISAAVCLGGAGAARAGGSDDATIAARESFAAGAKAFQRRDYRAAALAYETANRLSPSSIALYNAAASWEKVEGERPREADAYARALEMGGLPAAERAQAQARMEKLLRGLGRVRVEAPAGARVSIGDASAGDAPLTAHLPPGQVRLRVTFADGTVSTRQVAIRTGATSTERFEAPKPPPAPPPPRAEARFPVWAVLGWTGVGLAAASAGTAIGLGVAALDAEETYLADRNSGDTARATSSFEQADTLQTATNVAWVAAGAFAVAGAALLVIDLTRPDETDAVGWSFAPHGVGARSTLRF